MTLKKLNSNSNSNSLTLKKLNSNSNSNSLTLKNQNSNSNSNSLTLQKSNSNSNSNSSITCERIQIQIQNSNSIQPQLFYTQDSKRILQFASSKSQSRSRSCVLAHHSQGLREGVQGVHRTRARAQGGPGRAQVSALSFGMAP